MKLEDLYNEWDKDMNIRKDDLASESLKIPKLHSKYSKLFHNHRIVLNNKREELNELKKMKYEYYSGKFSQEDYKDTGWPIFELRLSKGEIDLYINGDKEYIQKNTQISLVYEKVDFLKSVLENINRRTFIIKGAIEWLKFINGEV